MKTFARLPCGTRTNPEAVDDAGALEAGGSGTGGLAACELGGEVPIGTSGLPDPQADPNQTTTSMISSTHVRCARCESLLCGRNLVLARALIRGSLLAVLTLHLRPVRQPMLPGEDLLSLNNTSLPPAAALPSETPMSATLWLD